MKGRTVAIGDMHGCSVALAALIEAIQPVAEDVLVPLGDYIDRGPDSRGVVEHLIDLGGKCRLIPLRGNHEEMLLAARSDDWAMRLWLSCGGSATLASYGKGAGLEAIPASHWAFLGGCRKVFETETHVFAHAKEAFRLPDDPEDERPLWPLFSGKVGIVGHAAQKSGEVLDEGCIKCIDTNCQEGSWLTALEVEMGRVWQANEQGKVRPGNLVMTRDDGRVR